MKIKRLVEILKAVELDYKRLSDDHGMDGDPESADGLYNEASCVSIIIGMFEEPENTLDDFAYLVDLSTINPLLSKDHNKRIISHALIHYRDILMTTQKEIVTEIKNIEELL